MYRAALIMGALLAAAAARAEFFMRVPKTAGAALASLGGTEMYSTAIRVNGAKGTLAAYAFSQVRADELEARVRKRLAGAKAARVIVAPAPGGRDQCIALAVEGAEAEGGAPSWPEAIPAFDALPTFTAYCEKTRTSFLSAAAAAEPGAAAEAAAAALAGAGYSEASPRGAACRIFTKGRGQAAVYSERQGDGRTAVSVVLREGSGR